MPKRVGLALGAGSTKGFAHIGVLQVLQRNNIPIDMIAGCSMGAIIGSIYAVGSDMDMLERYVTAMSLRGYLDIANPLGGGLIRGERIEELIRVLTHGKTFAETKTPFVCVAVDAVNGTLDVLDTGMLHSAVRASMSIPSIFSPHKLNGKTYVDGGVLRRVPCDTLRNRGMDVVIGVDVGYHGGETDVADMNAYQLLNHTIHLMQWDMALRHRDDADLMLVPEVQYITGIFQMDSVEECIEEGRRVATEALPAIRKLIGMAEPSELVR